MSVPSSFDAIEVFKPRFVQLAGSRSLPSPADAPWLIEFLLQRHPRSDSSCANAGLVGLALNEGGALVVTDATLVLYSVRELCQAHVSGGRHSGGLAPCGVWAASMALPGDRKQLWTAERHDNRPARPQCRYTSASPARRRSRQRQSNPPLRPGISLRPALTATDVPAVSLSSQRQQLGSGPGGHPPGSQACGWKGVRGQCLTFGSNRVAAARRTVSTDNVESASMPAPTLAITPAPAVSATYPARVSGRNAGLEASARASKPWALVVALLAQQNHSEFAHVLANLIDAGLEALVGLL